MENIEKNENLEPAGDTSGKPKKKFPHVYVLLFGIVLVCAILTYIVPAGSYEYVEITTSDGGTREVVDATSYTETESTPVGLMELLTSIPRGLTESASIIFFILIIGGSFGILQDTGAIAAGLGDLTKKLGNKQIIIIPVIMLAFAFGGAVIGMAEETLAFIPIMVSLALVLGYDSMTGAAMVLMGAGSGFAGAFLNPFTVGVAHGIAGLPLFSGMALRLILFVVIVTIGIVFVMRYASKIKKNPELSSMYEIDRARTDNLDLDNLPAYGGREKAILAVFALSLVLLVYGVMQYGWYLNEISALFLGMAVVVSIIGKLGFNGFGESLAKGMEAVVTGAVIVGFARAILVVLTDGNIIDTILHAAADGLSALPTTVTALGIYVFQCLLNFLIPSGSGQAAVSIPILAPLGDLVGVTRQTVVLAYQLGDGISNILVPTSGYFMAAIAMAKISWIKWAKWILPAILLWYLVGAIFVVIAQQINYGPF